MSMQLRVGFQATKVLGAMASRVAQKVNKKDRWRNIGHSIVTVDGTDKSELSCLVHTWYTTYNSTLFRIMCHAESFSAVRSMQHERRRMRLALDIPNVRAVLNFTTEALSSLPTGGISACVDFAYSKGDRQRDFNEWALAHQMLGFDRLYIADQLLYHNQVIDQLQRGFAVLTHDLPDRYVYPGAREPPHQPTSHVMFVRSTSAYNWLCLHEHWYDDWIFVALSTDEYFTFSGDSSRETSRNFIEPPRQPTRLIDQAIKEFWVRKQAPSSTHSLGWQSRLRASSCANLLCVSRPFYAPTNAVENGTTSWTQPRLGIRPTYGSETVLAIERFKRRYRTIPPKGSRHKCFARADWRLGSSVKAHSFTMQSCPTAPVLHCKLKKQGFRSLCLTQCGYFGDERHSLNMTCKGFRNDGMVIRDLELAHFRAPPEENKVDGYDEVQWLSRLAHPIRTAMAKFRPAA